MSGASADDGVDGDDDDDDDEDDDHAACLHRLLSWMKRCMKCCMLAFNVARKWVGMQGLLACGAAHVWSDDDDTMLHVAGSICGEIHGQLWQAYCSDARMHVLDGLQRLARRAVSVHRHDACHGHMLPHACVVLVIYTMMWCTQ